MWAGVGLELQRRTQGELEGGSFEWEGRGWGDGGTYGGDGWWEGFPVGAGDQAG